jgi:hypothetical protein
MVIDGRNFNVEWSSDLKVQFEILNGSNTGRLQQTGDMYLDYIGTFYNFSGEVIKLPSCTEEEWDEFIEYISNPINAHKVKVPFKQGYMLWDFYVSSGEVGIKKIQKDGKVIKTKTIPLNLVAMKSQWLAGQELKGYVEEPYNG